MDLQHQRQLRRIIEHPDFKLECKELIAKFHRFRDLLMAIRRESSECAHLDAIKAYGDYFLKRTAAIYETPSFTYYYRFDDTSVTLLHIEITDDDSDAS